MRRDELRRRIGAVRGELARLHRTLPRAEADQTAADAEARWHLERAISACLAAEDAYAETVRQRGGRE